MSELNTSLSSVYWIHLESHSDITSEGYIGVTSREPEERFKEHAALAKTGKSRLAAAIRKYKDNIVVTTLIKGSDEYCYLIENKLRPSEGIGWNLAIGGGKPPVNSRPHSEEQKVNIQKALLKTFSSKEHMLEKEHRKVSGYYKKNTANMIEVAKKKLPWEMPRANQDVWTKASTIYSHYLNGHGYRKVAGILSVNRAALKVIFDKFKQNWNPNFDPLWVEWVQNKEKEINYGDH